MTTGTVRLCSRLALVPLLAAAIAPEARAEGNTGTPRGADTADRVYAADFLKPVAGGLATVGGSTLRWLPPGGTTWTTLLTRPGRLSRLGQDDAGGRVLAVWERDPALHLVRLRDGHHATYRLPGPGLPGVPHTYVHSLAFTPGGDAALVYLTGTTKAGAPFHASRALRQELGGQRRLTRLVDLDDTGELLWTSGRGALCILPADPSQPGRWQANGTGGLVVFDFDGDTVRKRMIYYDPDNKFLSAYVVSGSTPDRLVVILRTGLHSEGVVTYAWGDAAGRYQPLPGGRGPRGRAALAQHSDELLFHVDRGREIEVFRVALSPPPATRSVRLGSPAFRPGVRGGARSLGRLVRGHGFRADGSVWVQVGDDLALIDPAGTVRRVDLAGLLGFRPAWAGAVVHAGQPGSLWIGIEGGGRRDHVRFGFDALERAATPWPGRVSIPSIPPVSAEQPGDRDRMTKCLPPDALIATPAGEIPVSRISVGMPVWTCDANGDRVAGTVIRTGRSIAPAGHRMVRIVLADGRTLSVSAGHPLPDGRTAGAWLTKASFDGSAIRLAESVPYTGSETFDLLPSGGTGIYWANGIPLASTLSVSPAP